MRPYFPAALQDQWHALFLSRHAAYIGGEEARWDTLTNRPWTMAEIVHALAGVTKSQRREHWNTFSESIRDGYSYLFLTHTMWTHGYAPGVTNICGYEYPDGSQTRCHTNGGNPGWQQIWIEE